MIQTHALSSSPLLGLQHKAFFNTNRLQWVTSAVSDGFAALDLGLWRGSWMLDAQQSQVPGDLCSAPPLHHQRATGLGGVRNPSVLLPPAGAQIPH